MEKINEGVFKAYDLRGIYPSEIDEDFAYKLGKAYATFVLEKNSLASSVVLSSDMRLSSPSLRAEVEKGILESGLNVIDIGMSSTPTFYFAVAYYGYDAGIQVSASHNPKDYNGFKMVLKNAYPVSKNSGIMRIKEIILKEEFQQKGGEKGIVFREANVLEDLVSEQLANIDISKIRRFKIVIDASNAMGALDMEEFFKCVRGDIIKLNFDLDGNFPSHEADPMKEENIALLKEEVKKNQADFGIAIDGDADRYFFVDENGELLRPEVLLAIMAQIELKTNPGAAICYDVRSGKTPSDIIEVMQGDPILTPVGHSLIKEIMIENDAVYGGESSGHYYFREHYGTFEMPTVFLANFLQFLSSEKKPFSETVSSYKKYFPSGEINRKVNDQKAVLERIKENYKDGKISEIDGISVEYPDFWFNVRTSNTEPLVRLNLESRSQELTDEKAKEVLAVIEK
jgi:phosphomannomutase